MQHHKRLIALIEYCKANPGKQYSVTEAQRYLQDLSGGAIPRSQVENTFIRMCDATEGFSIVASNIVFETPELRQARIAAEKKAAVQACALELQVLRAAQEAERERHMQAILELEAIELQIKEKMLNVPIWS